MAAFKAELNALNANVERFSSFFKGWGKGSNSFLKPKPVKSAMGIRAASRPHHARAVKSSGWRQQSFTGPTLELSEKTACCRAVSGHLYPERFLVFRCRSSGAEADGCVFRTTQAGMSRDRSGLPLSWQEQLDSVAPRLHRVCSCVHLRWLCEQMDDDSSTASQDDAWMHSNWTFPI